MAAKANNSEKIEPSSAEAISAMNIRPCRPQKLPAALAASNTGVTCRMRTHSTPMNAPKIIMPSSARLITPLRSAKMPASATIIRGTA